MENYGRGKSTGIDQTASGAIETGFVLNDMKISDSDAAILRPLAEQVGQIASSPRMDEIRRAKIVDADKP